MFSLAQAIAGAALYALTEASEPTGLQPQFYDKPPFETIDDIHKAIVGGNAATCEAGIGTVEIVVVELKHDTGHYTLFVLGDKWVMARYIPELNQPQMLWYGLREGRRFAVKQTLPFQPGMDPCHDWLTPPNG